jgi:hypothetical protein
MPYFAVTVTIRYDEDEDWMRGINKINRNLQWFHRVALLPLNPIGI